MRSIGWMAFVVTLLVGGGLNVMDYLGAGPEANPDKMAEAKETLLAKPVTTLNIRECEVTIQALKRLYEQDEDIVLRLSIKNPTPKEQAVCLPLRVDVTTSSMMARMLPIPVRLIEQKIEVVVPAGSTENREIILSHGPRKFSKPVEVKDAQPTTNIVNFGLVTSYSAYITRTKDDKKVPALMCSFSSNTSAGSAVEKLVVTKK